jgi:hypothetical protein
MNLGSALLGSLERRRSFRAEQLSCRQLVLVDRQIPTTTCRVRLLTVGTPVTHWLPGEEAYQRYGSAADDEIAKKVFAALEPDGDV